MSFENWLGPFCALVSAVFVVILAATDRKRRQLRRGASWPMTRAIAAFAIFLQGLALALYGRWSDFLIWIGAAAVIGWGIAAAFNLHKSSRLKR